MIPEATTEAQKELLDLMNQIEAKGDEQIAGLINQWRQSVVVMIAEEQKLDVLTVESLKARLRAMARQVDMRLEKIISDNQRRQFVKGIQIVDKTLRTGNITSALPYLDENNLNILQKFTASQITNITSNAVQAITTELDLATLGQKSAMEVIENIGKNLTDPSVFGTIARRAQVIFQTEMKRIQNITTIDRMKQASSQVKDIGKKWVHSHIGVPRPFHLLLNGTVVGADEQFELIGKDGESYMIDAPHDPSLPVGEVANCRCMVVPVAMRFLKNEAAVN